MAFQMNFQIEPGVNIASLKDDESVEMLILNVPFIVERGYVKIEYIEGDKEQIRAFIGYRKNRDDVSPLKTKEVIFIPSVADDAPNYHKQLYDYLKNQEEFKSAIDVLEYGQSA